MGVRLYPRTKDRAVIERCAGVPPGTYDRLEMLEEWFMNWPTPDAMLYKNVGYIKYTVRGKHFPMEDQLHSFLLYGWGKGDYGPSCVGKVTEEEDVEALLERNPQIREELQMAKVTWKECEGLCWS